MKSILSVFKHQRDVTLIKESGLFDEGYYLTHYPQVKGSGLEPVEHYVKVGSSSHMKPNAFFDGDFYCETNPDVKNSGVNPLVHFIKFGAKEGRNPSRNFNTRYYLEEHPDVATTGVNPLWHFLNYGQGEKREADNSRNEALSAANHILYEELLRIQPLLPPFNSLPYVPLRRSAHESLPGRAYFKLVDAIKKPVTHLFVVPSLMHGGAGRLAMHYVALAKERLGADSVLVLLVDFAKAPAIHLLPGGVSMLILDEIQPGLSVEEKIQILSRLIIEMQPQVVHNVNSDICWQVYQRYHHQLRPATALVASLFTCHYDEEGRRVGLVPQYLNSCIENIDLILTDNAAFKKDVTRFYALEKRNQDKISVAYTPVLDMLREPDPKGSSSRHVAWASRLHADKRPDLLAAIAKRLPDITFEAFGASALEDSEYKELDSLENIRLHGAYSNFEELPLAGMNAYLYTTKHDGLPISIMEAIAAGLPTIAPDIGGTCELINPETGWFIEKADDVEAYTRALRECLNNPQERMRRACNAQNLLRRQHSWENFSSTVAAIPAYRLTQKILINQKG